MPRLMTGQDYRESLRRYKPRVFVDGQGIESVADAPAFQPGINAIALTYDHALKPGYERLMTAVQHTNGKRVNRFSHINTSAGDLLNKLEAVRLVCQETGCAQRYLTHDALNAIAQVSARIDDARGSTEHTARFHAFLHRVQDQDLTLGVAMTDAKGDRSRRPHEQANVDSYLHIVECNARGIVISGTKAIVTAAPYVHELLVMPCRNMGREDADFAVCCAVPLDAPGLTIVARAAGRPGEKLEHCAALFSRKYGQSTGVCMFDRVFVPWDCVFYAGEWEHSGHLTYSYATHHRQSCIGARAGFGDLLIGAGAADVRGQRIRSGQGDPPALEQMVELITITESFFNACWRGGQCLRQGRRTLRSVHARPGLQQHRQGNLLLATKIYDMHAHPAHYVSGGLVVALPGPDEDHNPETAARLSDVLRANPAVPYEQRIETARFIEDLTAGYQGGWYSLISLHGGGSPAAMEAGDLARPPGRLQGRAGRAAAGARRRARPRPRHHQEPPTGQMLRHRMHHPRTTGDGRPAEADPSQDVRLTRCRPRAVALAAGALLFSGCASRTPAVPMATQLDRSACPAQMTRLAGAAARCLFRPGGIRARRLRRRSARAAPGGGCAARRRAAWPTTTTAASSIGCGRT